MTGTKVRQVGQISYDDLPGDVKDDVVESVADITREDKDDVRAGLENGPAILPVVEVDPEEILDPNRSVSENVVAAYAEALAEGLEFPPVVIDSSKAALLEGGHRTAAAVEEGLKAIKAIDIAGVRVVKVGSLETYDFKHARRRAER